jgi:hypothetical protein
MEGQTDRVVKAVSGLLVVLAMVGLAGPVPWSATAAAPMRPVTAPTTPPPQPPPSSVGPLPTGSTPPSTIPLTTKGQSGHVSPVFAVLSGVGAAVVLLILGTQWLLTRPGRRHRWTL